MNPVDMEGQLYIHTMEYDSVIVKNKPWYAMTWISLKNIVKWKKAKNTFCKIPFVWNVHSR